MPVPLSPRPELAEVASGYVSTIVDAVRREYPNSLRHVMRAADDRPTPRTAHPAFYGCLDWHSSVEMHWALVRLLRVAPESVGVDGAVAARAVLDEHFQPDALQAEADYLLANPAFERPYGWGWALTLAAEVSGWDDPDAIRWGGNLRPLVDTVAAALTAWLPRMPFPERVGTHQNSAFALYRALPWARLRAGTGDTTLLDAISDAAVRWFASDVEYPASWEPGGADFLSPALAEALLIAELAQPAEAFPEWLGLFLPGLAEARPDSLFSPVLVTDPDDGQGAHLHGLNLFRAHAFDVLARHLAPGDQRVEPMLVARDRHAAAALPAVTGAGWMVEHWLAAYAVMLLA